MLFSDAVFNIFAGVFDVPSDVRQNVAVVLLFLYSCSYAVMRNLDAIIRVSMLLCETSMRLFVSVCCYAKSRCYYSCPYAVMRSLDAIICVRMLLCQTSMLLFVSVCCYAKP